MSQGHHCISGYTCAYIWAGKVFAGQKLLEIAGRSLTGLDNSDIAGLILGPPGNSEMYRINFIKHK